MENLWICMCWMKLIHSFNKNKKYIYNKNLRQEEIIYYYILVSQVLEKYPNTPMSHKEILQVIQREGLKEIR